MAKTNPLRDAEALAYRARGWTYERIANEMGYTDKSAARKAAQRGYAAAITEANDEAKALILTDLNAAKQAAWAVLEANHITISNGRVMLMNGAPIPDDAPVLNAIDRVIKIDQEMAKILGVYAPTRQNIEITTELDHEIEQLARQLAGSAEAGEGTPAPAPAD